MLRKLFTREDKTNPRRAEERGYKPMPENWKPAGIPPNHQTGQAGQTQQPQRTDTNRPKDPQQ